MRYFGILDGGPGAWGLSIPDCPGCTAIGETQDEAITNAIEALAEWVGDDQAPAPSDIATLKKQSDVAETLGEGGVFVLIPLVQDGGKSVKANISMPKGMLEAIDDAAANLGLTRSSFLTSAAKEKLKSSY